MKRRHKRILRILIGVACAYFLGIQALGFLIKKGFTNSESKAVVISTGAGQIQTKLSTFTGKIYDYLIKNPQHIDDVFNTWVYLNGNENIWQEKSTLFPQDVIDNPAFKFTANGIYKRTEVINGISDQSQILGIDKDLVLSSILGEQLRISTKGFRGRLKNTVLYGTPQMFRSYDISLGIGGIKTTTARKIIRDASSYGYGDLIYGHQFMSNDDLEGVLTENDYMQGVYPTYLVKNILTRWAYSGVDISNMPGVVGTLYNFGNHSNKMPHKNPQIGGSIITVGDRQYVYGGICRGFYWYLKINK